MKLKVRPKKSESSYLYLDHATLNAGEGKVVAPCAVQLATMLNCWASTGDTRSISSCADTARDLRRCMGTAVCRSPPLSSELLI